MCKLKSGDAKNYHRQKTIGLPNLRQEHSQGYILKIL
jgi:hypothetical protein